MKNACEYMKYGYESEPEYTSDFSEDDSAIDAIDVDELNQFGS